MITLHGDTCVDLWVVGKHRSVCNVSAPMVNPFEALLFINHESEPVSGFFTICEHIRSHHFFYYLGISYLRISIVLHPDLQILYRGVNASSTDGTTQIFEFQKTVSRGCISNRSPLHDMLWTRTYHCTRHAKRTENVVRHKFMKPLSGGAFNNHSS